jgi:hypothetical protein
MKQILRLSSVGFLLLFSFGLFAQDEPIELENAAENHTACLKCHGQSFYSFYNDWTETDARKIMPQEYRIDTVLYYQSSHYSFKCTDCHTPDYETFPHDGELRKEFMNTCLDCHGGDEDYAEFMFEEVEEAFNSSVHSPDVLINFSCWQCHNPHYYKLDYRNTENLLSTIERNNQACMNCHNKEGHMRLYSDEPFKELAATHDFLPNQRAHYEKVRCLECHGEVGEDLLVAHNILPKEESVKNCKECHSKNSLLMTTLYRYQSIESSNKFGFYNATILNESYVIGATRNHWLNILTIIVFSLSVLAIITHAIILKISKK